MNLEVSTHLNPTTGVSHSDLLYNEASQHSTQSPTENSPLLNNSSVQRIEEIANYDGSADNVSKVTMFWEELIILTKYALPVFGYGTLVRFLLQVDPVDFHRTCLFEFSLIIVSVISIGHLSTTALAGVSLGSMTATISGYSVIQGFTSALDTILPSAWTSSQPHLVGLWAQRMSWCITTSVSWK